MSMHGSTPPPTDFERRYKLMDFLIACSVIIALISLLIYDGKSNSFKETYSGVVTRKFKNKEDNHAITVIFNNNQEVRFPFMAKDFFSTIQVGDSLNK